jgi:hypothetical protein
VVAPEQAIPPADLVGRPKSPTAAPMVRVPPADILSRTTTVHFEGRQSSRQIAKLGQITSLKECLACQFITNNAYVGKIFAAL